MLEHRARSRFGSLASVNVVQLGWFAPRAACVSVTACARKVLTKGKSIHGGGQLSEVGRRVLARVDEQHLIQLSQRIETLPAPGLLLEHLAFARRHTGTTSVRKSLVPFPSSTRSIDAGTKGEHGCPEWYERKQREEEQANV